MKDHTVKVYQSSKNDVWLTPGWIKHYAYEKHGCDFDPVPYDPDVDALKTTWDHWEGHKPFYNPPYSKNTEFLQKLIEELEAGRIDEALVLTFTNTSVEWWEEQIQPHAYHIDFIARRVNFIHPEKDNTGGAMRPSSLIHIDPDADRWKHPEVTCTVMSKSEQAKYKEMAENRDLQSYG